MNSQISWRKYDHWYLGISGFLMTSKLSNSVIFRDMGTCALSVVIDTFLLPISGDYGYKIMDMGVYKFGIIVDILKRACGNNLVHDITMLLDDGHSPEKVDGIKTL